MKFNREEPSEDKPSDESSEDEQSHEPSDDEQSSEDEQSNEDIKPPNPVKSSIGIKKLFAALYDNRFADVILTTKDKVEIKSHRCILGHFSEVFAKIIENSSEIPVHISVENFEAEIVEAALEFLCGQSETLNGKKDAILKFAEEYEIEELKKAFRPPLPWPKRAMSAFFFWMGANRDKIKENGMSVADVAKAAGVKWRSLSNDEKAKWEKIAEDDKNRYEKELTIYFNQ